ncbi:MAG: PspA/IM30 family protein [Ruminococcus callidus]
MGIFSRIGDVVKSNINDLIDRAEDPEKMVKQIILDLQKEVSNATTALGKKASERIAKRQYDDAVKTSADWEMKAKAALNAGEVDLAKKALSNKVKADESVKQYQQMVSRSLPRRHSYRNRWKP